MALPRLLPATVAFGVLALGLGGCVSDHRDVTGSVRTEASLPNQQSSLESYAADWGRRYDSDPANRTTALNYAAGLRALGRYPQAVAVLETVAIKYPYDKVVLAAYGKALADAGRLREAADVLPKAHTPDKPDWSVLSAQGSVADQMGDHASAQGYYDAALKIEPNSASTLSNLGLSLALDKRLPEAEAALRRAAALPAATPKIRENLSFVLALEGKDAEAEAVIRPDMSAADAATSVAAVKAMMQNPVAPSARPRQIAPRAAALPATAG